MKKEIERRLHELSDSHDGTLTPEIVVEEAKDRHSPLHGEFDWNNSVAAHKWRLEQARTLIRSVKITVVEDRQEIRTVAYIRDPRCEPTQQGYVSVQRAKSEEELAREAIASESVRVRSALIRMRELAKFLQLEEEFNGLIDRINHIRGRVVG